MWLGRRNESKWTVICGVIRRQLLPLLHFIFCNMSAQSGKGHTEKRVNSSEHSRTSGAIPNNTSTMPADSLLLNDKHPILYRRV